MTQKNTPVPAALFRRLMRIMVVPAAVLVLASCSGYEKLPAESMDGNYKVFSVISGNAGSMNIFFIRLFESEGMLAMCGGYTRGESSFGKQGSRYWADVSKVRLGDTEIGSAEFMNEMPVYGLRDSQEFEEFVAQILEAPPATNCERSDVPWRDEFKIMEIERTGPNTITIFD